MRKSIIQKVFVFMAVFFCASTFGMGHVNVNANAQEGEETIYTQNFTDLDEVNRDFSAYYQTAMGASSFSMDVGTTAEDYCNWYIHDGILTRKVLDDDISDQFETESFAILTLTKRTYVNFELTVDYKRDGDTFFWPIVAFRQTEPGQYFLEDGVGVFMQRDGKATMWGGEGVGGPYESVSHGSYVDSDWHTLRLRVEGLNVSIYIDDEISPMLSKDLPKNMFRHGYISLTSVNNACSFKNLTIEELEVVDIDSGNKQEPVPETDSRDALENMAENVEKIDELNGLTQQPKQEKEDGCGSNLSMSVVPVLTLLGICALYFVKKRR